MLLRPCLRIIPIMFLALAGIASATTFNEQPFPETVQDAPNIVRGKVGTSYANWALGSDGAKRIYTFYELSLDEVLKGSISGSGSIMMREMGGEKDGVGMRISGTAHFERGEDVVVFLGAQNPDGSYDVHGMMMGKYQIERGEDGKEYLVGAGISETLRPELRGHENVMEKFNGAPNDNHPRSKWSVDSLRGLIKSQAAGESSKSNESGSPQSSIATAAPGKSPAPPATQSVTTASQLQPEDADASSVPWVKILVGIGGLLLGALVLAAMVRSRQRRYH